MSRGLWLGMGVATKLTNQELTQQREHRQQLRRYLCVQVGVPEGRLRKWLLSIAALLRSQNGGLAAGIRLWRKNCSQVRSCTSPFLQLYSAFRHADHRLINLLNAFGLLDRKQVHAKQPVREGDT